MKEYTICKTYRGRETRFTGTLEELINNVFGYTLDVGCAHNPKINRHPKTIRGLMTSLSKSVSEAYGCCYERPYYDLVI